MAQTAACYTYAPQYAGAPAPGDQMGFVLTDQGRVALADRIGSGVTRVTGRLDSVDGDDYVVAVDGVETIGNGSAHWTGERVHIRKDYVAGVQARKFSRGRTALAVGIAAGVVGALIGAASLAGYGFLGGGGSSSGGQNGS